MFFIVWCDFYTKLPAESLLEKNISPKGRCFFQNKYYKNLSPFGGKVFIVQQARGGSYNWYLAKTKIFLLLRVLYYIKLDNAGALNQCILQMHFTRIWKCGSQNKLRVL